MGTSVINCPMPCIPWIAIDTLLTLSTYPSIFPSLSLPIYPYIFLYLFHYFSIYLPLSLPFSFLLTLSIFILFFPLLSIYHYLSFSPPFSLSLIIYLSIVITKKSKERKKMQEPKENSDWRTDKVNYREASLLKTWRILSPRWAIFNIWDQIFFTLAS